MDWRVEFDGSVQRKEYPEIPVDAVREAVVNAFGHRAIESMQAVEVAIYKSYVDIYSPGKFPDGVSPEQFITEALKPIRRNPLITRVLYYSKDMESFATGFKRIYELCSQAGVKVEYLKEEYGFTVRFHRHCGESWRKNGALKAESGALEVENGAQEPKNEIKAKLRELIFQNPKISRKEMADSLGIGLRSIQRLLNEMGDARFTGAEGTVGGKLSIRDLVAIGMFMTMVIGMFIFDHCLTIP